MMAAEPSYKIFIRGIAPTVDENGLELAFSKYGRIMEVVLLRDKETKASRGLGFITFECTEDCEDAVRGMNGQELKGSILQVEIATEKPGYQNNPRGRGFVRGGRGGFTGRGVESGRFPARGGRLFGSAPPNRYPPVRGRGAYARGGVALGSQRERFPGPAEYGDGRQPYPGPDMRGECRPHMAPNAEPMGYRAPTAPCYSYPERPAGSRGPEGDYEGRTATWARPENISGRRPERGYPLIADPEYSQRDPERAYDADYDAVDRRGYEAGYGLVDRRTSEGYPPPSREERPDYSYSAQADYTEYPSSDWNGEYNSFDRAATERRPLPGQGYGMADSDRYKNAESRGYGIEDVPECRVTEPDRAYGVATGDVQRSKRGYPPPMDPYAASEDYGGRERKPDYSSPDVRRGYGGGGPVNPCDYGYGPVEEVESRGTSDWEYRPSGSVRHLERGEMESSGPQRAEYGRAEPEVAHRGYPVRDDYRRAEPGPDSRAYGYPDPARYADWEIQEDEFTYEDRRDQRNPAPRSRGYPADPELDASGDYVFPDPALGRSHRRPYGAYGSVSAHSEGFSGGRPTRGLPRGARGSDSGLRHPPPRADAEEPEAKRKYAPDTRGSYAASRGGRMPFRGSGRRAGRH